MKKTQYKLTWRRVGWEEGRKKSKTFFQKPALERYKLLLTDYVAAQRVYLADEYNLDLNDPDIGNENLCCSGYDCGCQGLTFSDSLANIQNDSEEYPPIEWLKQEQRMIDYGKWSESEQDKES